MRKKLLNGLIAAFATASMSLATGDIARAGSTILLPNSDSYPHLKFQ